MLADGRSVFGLEMRTIGVNGLTATVRPILDQDLSANAAEPAFNTGRRTEDPRIERKAAIVIRVAIQGWVAGLKSLSGRMAAE
jgi:hypothetical protein